MNMSGNYCGFMALSVMIIGKLKIYSACCHSRDSMQKKKEMITLSGKCWTVTSGWTFLGRGRLWDSAPQSCRSLMWWATLGIIPQAPDPIPAWFAHCSDQPFPSAPASSFFLSSKRPASWSRWNPSLNSSVMTGAESRAVCHSSKAGRWEHCQKTRGFSHARALLSQGPLCPRPGSQTLFPGKADAARMPFRESLQDLTSLLCF